MRIAAVDLVSNTCFPLLAAAELGFFKAEGLDVEIELFPMLQGTQALRSGAVDLMAAGSVYDILTEFPNWRGAKVVAALAQGTPWVLTVRSDVPGERGDFSAIKGLRITAAEGPDLAFKQMLVQAGLNPARDVKLVELPGARDRDVSFGVFAAKALMEGSIDGFWANAMGAETAVSSGAGKILIDVRRGDDPGNVRNFTFAAIATTDECIKRDAKGIGGCVTAIVRAQSALRSDPSLARIVGIRKFPPECAELIARTIARDVGFYDPVISEQAVLDLNSFAKTVGHLSGPVRYEDVVGLQFQSSWTQCR